MFFVVADFNVDFDRSSPRSKLLCEFMSNLGLVYCDLSFRDEFKLLMSVIKVSVVLDRSYFMLSAFLYQYQMCMQFILVVFYLTTSHYFSQ